MRHIQSFNSYNESFKSILTGGALLLTLFSNSVRSQDTQKELKQKAKMCQMDNIQMNKVVDSIKSKKFGLYKDDKIITNKTLFSNGTGITFEQALKNAEEDMKIKIDFLGRKGNQKIYVNEEAHTYNVIIITEILEKKPKHPIYDQEGNFYR
jgi:hypothetical protein